MKLIKPILLLTITLSGLFLLSRPAHAMIIGGGDGTGADITTSSPVPSSEKWNPGSTSFPGSANLNGDRQPYYDIGNNSTQYDHQTAKIKIYMKPGNTVDLTITNAGPNCHSEQSAGLVGPDYAQNSSSSGPRTYFWVTDGFTAITGTKIAEYTDGCGYSVTFSNINTSAGSNIQVNGSPVNIAGYTKYIVLIAQTPAGSIVGENSFRVSSSSTDDPVGYSSGYAGYGYRDENLNNGNYWTSQLKFGVDESCATLGQNQQGQVNYADADANITDWNPSIEIMLQQKPWSDPTAPWVTRVDRTNSYLKANNNGILYSGSFNPDYKYRVLIMNAGVRNTVFIQISGYLSQLSGTYHMQQSDCQQPVTATCNPVPSDPSPNSGDPITMTVNLKNTSAPNGSGGPKIDNTYQLRQTSPGGMAINVNPSLAPNNSEPIGPYNINARTTTTSITVTFTYQLFDSAGNNVGTSCSKDVTWSSAPTGPLSCIATPDKATHPLGEGATVTVKLFNNSGSSLPGTDEMRQVAPGGQVKGLGTSLASGSSRVLPPYTINARTTAQTVTFQYALFSGSLAGSPAVGPNPMCNTTITWNGSGVTPPPASFSVACGYTHVYNLASTATTSTTTSGGTYQTYQQPDNYPSTPYVWASPPPPAGSPFLPGVPTYSYTPTTTTSSTATTIPLHFHFAGSDGSSNDAYFDKSRGDAIGNPIADQPFDTFNQFGFLWPHISYTVTLEAQTSGDLGAGENGPYTYNQQLGSQSLNGDCLDASCGTPSSVDAEPGQTKTLSYGVYVYNSTNKTFSANDSNGYHFSVGSDGGIVNINNVNASPDISPGNPSTTNVSFSARIDYTGGFWVTMLYKGGAISLPRLSVPCPPGSVTPATRAFFEVRGSDISTGGGFSDANSVCATTAPGYVSPATGYSSTSGRYDYAGGVRAYANPNAGTGSEAEYGLLSLGLTIGSPNGPIGFFSGHNEVFANTGVPNAPNGGNLGGYLSPSGPTSAHCVDDFFTKTRIINTTPIPFTGNSLTGLASGQYEYNGPMTLTSSGCGTPSVSVGKQITLYVDGDVTINNNICYAKQWDPTNRANIPYFALIVHGNITLTSGVSQLDGLYVSQPTNDTDGIFSTCDTFCPNQLIVNGAVIAQQVSLNRAHGTLGPLDADVNNISSQPAEIFNYVPSMIIGTPNFNPLYNSLEALFSLPPVF